MSEYDAYESVFKVALPQIHTARSGQDLVRAVTVTTDADQDFVITATQVKISPKVLAASNGSLDIAKFCNRISDEVIEFDTRAEKDSLLIREEWQTKLNRAVLEITRRYPGDLSKMILTAINNTKEDA